MTAFANGNPSSEKSMEYRCPDHKFILSAKDTIEESVKELHEAVGEARDNYFQNKLLIQELTSGAYANIQFQVKDHSERIGKIEGALETKMDLMKQQIAELRNANTRNTVILSAVIVALQFIQKYILW